MLPVISTPFRSSDTSLDLHVYVTFTAPVGSVSIEVCVLPYVPTLPMETLGLPLFRSTETELVRLPSVLLSLAVLAPLEFVDSEAPPPEMLAPSGETVPGLAEHLSVAVSCPPSLTVA